MIWKKLFGSAAGGDGRLTKKAVEYNGYTIVPAPKKSGARYYTAGFICEKGGDGGGAALREKHFIRADTYNDADAACDNAILKGRRIIDEQGDALFD